MYNKIHPFKVHNAVTFNIFRSCASSPQSDLENFHVPQKKAHNT